MRDEISMQCPWCGERFDALVDRSEGSTEYVEDCPVCCRPISFRLDTDASGDIESFVAGRDD